MCTDHVYSTPTLSTTFYIMSIFFPLFVPDFLAIFALITIFVNVHKPYKQLSNVTTPSLFFSSFFPYFFYLKMQNLPYLAILVFILVTKFWCHFIQGTVPV